MTATVVAAVVKAQCWSADEEEFNADSLGELIDSNCQLRPGQTVWVGEPSYPDSTELFDADDALDQMRDRACDFAGEHADGYPCVTVEQVNELGALIRGWIEKHARPTFYTVKNVKPYVLTADDIPDAPQIESAHLIQPIEVVRDEFGFWTHPDLPSFDEGDGEKYSAWLAEQGLRISMSALENDPDNPAYVTYFEDSCLDISSWNPAPPAGEGWFPLAINDTEDGPVFCWATRAPGGAA